MWWSMCHHHGCSSTSSCLNRLEVQRWPFQARCMVTSSCPKCPLSNKSTPYQHALPTSSWPRTHQHHHNQHWCTYQSLGNCHQPAEIGPNHHGSLRCKVNTGASDNVMLLCIFAKLLPRCITRDGKPTRLHPCDTSLMVYNGSNIPQFGALDTAIEWTPMGHQHSKASPNQMVCSRQSLDQPYLASLPHQSWELSSWNAHSNSPADVTHPAHPRNLQQKVLRVGMTSLLHSTPAKT